MKLCSMGSILWEKLKEMFFASLAATSQKHLFSFTSQKWESIALSKCYQFRKWMSSSLLNNMSSFWPKTNVPNDQFKHKANAMSLATQHVETGSANSLKTRSMNTFHPTVRTSRLEFILKTITLSMDFLFRMLRFVQWRVGEKFIILAVKLGNKHHTTAKARDHRKGWGVISDSELKNFSNEYFSPLRSSHNLMKHEIYCKECCRPYHWTLLLCRKLHLESELLSRPT